MALELVMNLEKSFGIDISPGSSDLTVLGIADEIIAHVDGGKGREEAVATTLAEQHAEKVEPSQIETIKDMLINGLLRHYFSIAIAVDHQISRTVRSQMAGNVHFCSAS